MVMSATSSMNHSANMTNIDKSMKNTQPKNLEELRKEILGETVRLTKKVRHTHDDPTMGYYPEDVVTELISSAITRTAEATLKAVEGAMKDTFAGEDYDRAIKEQQIKAKEWLGK